MRTTVRTLSKEADVRAAIAVVAGDTDRLTFFVADLTDDSGWDAATSGCDYVLHVASPLGGGASAIGVADRTGARRHVAGTSRGDESASNGW